MALWGNNDNLVSNGTVALNYATKVVTGTGTTFGTVGFGVTGDVIRFGARGPGTASTYFGDAVIVGIASTTQCTIGSTAGLSGVAIGGTEYHLSQLPKSSVLDHSTDAGKDGLPSYVTYADRPSRGFAAVGSLSVPVLRAKRIGITTNTKGKDALVNDGNTIEINAVGSATSVTKSGQASPVGFSTIFFPGGPPAGIRVNESTLEVASGGSVKPILITSIGSTSVGLAATISAQINGGTTLTFRSDNIVSLASGITVGISTGDELLFQRLKGGYDKVVYGIGDGTSQIFDESSTVYRTSGSGWVGVTTYMDCHGNVRVKSEILVAMGGNSQDATAGIQTGSNGILYPTVN